MQEHINTHEEKIKRTKRICVWVDFFHLLLPFDYHRNVFWLLTIKVPNTREMKSNSNIGSSSYLLTYRIEAVANQLETQMTHLFSGTTKNVLGAVELGDCVCELDMRRRWSKEKAHRKTLTANFNTGRERERRDRVKVPETQCDKRTTKNNKLNVCI